MLVYYESAGACSLLMYEISSSSKNTCCLHCLPFITEERKKKLINVLCDVLIQNVYVTISQRWIMLLPQLQSGSSERMQVFELDQTLFFLPKGKEKKSDLAMRGYPPFIFLYINEPFMIKPCIKLISKVCKILHKIIVNLCTLYIL